MLVRSSLSVVVFSFGALSALAVPVERRKSVLSTCNDARLGVISGLNSTSTSIEDLLRSSNDSTITFASNQALSGMRTSQEGVAIIVKGVLAGVTPDDTGVPAVANGLATAAQVLTSINSTDPDVQSKLATILTQLKKTKTNGDTAITECAKLSSSESTSFNSTSSNSTTSNSNFDSIGFTKTVNITAIATTTTDKISGTASVQTEADRALISGFGRRASNSSSPQCDTSKTVAVSAFQQAIKRIQGLAKAAASANSAQSAAQAAISALAAAGEAVSQVHSNNATSFAANTIGQGILDAQNSLNTINSTDSAFNGAQLDMISVLHAGEKLAIECTPTAGGVELGKRRGGLRS